MFGVIVLFTVLASWAASPTDASAQEATWAVPDDAATVDVRRPPAGALASYRDDSRFDYDRAVPQGASWWGRLQQWLAEHLFGPLTEVVPSRFAQWVLYGLAGAAVVYAIIRLLGMDAGGAFYRRERRERSPVPQVEGMHEIDFESAIASAETRGDFREAVRLRYLRLIRKLDERGRLEARPVKTNRQYVDELAGTALSAPFRALTTLFEYVWYGDVELGAARYATVRARFDDLERDVET